VRTNLTPMAESPTVAQYDQSERDKVASWRLHVLMEAGYPLPLAERLADSGADLHRAVELVTQGCTFETAAEILL
jgi:purine nucleoside phosphorylase